MATMFGQRFDPAQLHQTFQFYRSGQRRVSAQLRAFLAMLAR